jgi:signal transduction histidine kinase
MVSKQTHTLTHDNIDIALAKATKVLLNSLDLGEVVQRVVNDILEELNTYYSGYRIIVLGLVDEKNGLLKRTSISRTIEAQLAVGELTENVTDIETPLSAKDNYCIRVLNDPTPLVTHDWEDILTPPFTPEQSRASQKQSGIKTSLIYPLLIGSKALGMMIFSLNKHANEISDEEKRLIQEFVDVTAVAVQNARLYSSMKESKDRLQDAFEKLKKLDEMKNEFLAITSHDLRTPLSIIRNYLWMLLNKKSELLNDPQSVMYLKTCYESSERMIKLVNNTLTVSKIDNNHLLITPVYQPIEPLLDDISREFTDLTKTRQINFVYEKPTKPLAQLSFDKDRIREVIVNLITNAMNYTPPNGTITLNVQQTDHVIQVEVKDTGKGIEQENLKKLFNKFGRIEGALSVYSTAATGSGLGLYICKNLIGLHNGKLWVDSELDKGSTFSFMLPITAPDAKNM